MKFSKKTCSNLLYFLVATFPIVLIGLVALSLSGETSSSDLFKSLEECLTTFNGFFSSSLYDWYRDLLSVFGISSITGVWSIVYYYPLYLTLITFVKVILDIVLFLPHAITNWITKIGGESNEQ